MSEQVDDIEQTLEELKANLWLVVHTAEDIRESFRLWKGRQPVAGWEHREKRLQVCLAEAEEHARWLLEEAKL